MKKGKFRTLCLYKRIFGLAERLNIFIFPFFFEEEISMKCRPIINCLFFHYSKRRNFKWIKKPFTDVKSTTNVEADGADFEEAIALTGYGKFNYIVLLIVLPCCTSNVFDTTTMSIILPSAECDLNLTMQDKGMLNAITYMGEENAWRFKNNLFWFVVCNFSHVFSSYAIVFQEW